MERLCGSNRSRAIPPKSNIYSGLALIVETPSRSLTASTNRKRLPAAPSCRPPKRRRNGVFDRHGISHALRSVENLETHHIAAGIVVQDDAAFILIAFRHRRVVQ